MAHERVSREEEAPPAVLLAGLLRGWWEGAGAAGNGSRPTQQALASRLGIDQTTLSRYLNPKHPSTAPLRVVEALHTRLRAPQEELERAREWCEAALEAQRRQRTGTDEAPPAGPGSADGLPRDREGAVPLRSRWALLLTVAAVVLAFLAGAVVRPWFAPGRPDSANGDSAAAAPSAADGPLDWPLLTRKRHEDQFTRGRALQNLLKQHGYDLEADGIFGDKTYAAVVDFQRRNHLPPDGKVGEDTWPALVREVGLGAEGFAVQAAQELVNNTEQGAAEVSGRFTATTAADVRSFQRAHRLHPTGRVDEGTWLALLVFQRAPDDTPPYQKSPGPSPTVRT
ncbi:peptidoglycan-binding protein [Streptomyces sp. NPDC056061]|uniref:peptidoglycan-binding domain-containing protein n=1 Tax=Streptomyces sp. NPDC056061 TaxID=3345700 RepID=UPI0035E315E8